MRIVLDAMGGDYVPQVPVAGAVEAARAYGVEVVLVGREAEVKTELAKHDTTGLALPIVDAPETIEMGEHPAMAVRRKTGSSIVVGMRMVRDGQADAFVSAGHSGAIMAAATLILGRLPGVDRPCLATVFPRKEGFLLFADIGANTDTHPDYLLQFAYMVSCYAEKVFDVANPRVGLLANGEEETKGDKRVQEAHVLLRHAAGLNFVGNVEPKEMLGGAADVVIADGFVGNLVLKGTEATADLLLGMIREELMRTIWTKLPAALLKPAFRRIKARLDYSEYGGAPLIGVKGIAIIGHGRSDAHAVASAIRVAGEAVSKDVVAAVAQSVSLIKPHETSDAGAVETAPPTG